MSYVESGGLSKYFIPNIPLADATAGVMEEMDIGGSSADHGEYICIRPCVIKEAGFILSGEAASGTSVAPLVVFKKRPTPLSATGETAISTLTITSGAAIGAVTVDSDLDVLMAVGDSVEIAHVVGTGTPTGKGFPFLNCDDCYEVHANNSDVSETI